MGRMLKDGHVALAEGLEKKGISWQSNEWQVFDNGEVIFNDSSRTKVTGLQTFGTVDERNVFHLLPKINERFVDWNLLRKLNIRKGLETQRDSKKESSIPPPIFNTTAELVFVKDSDIELLHGEELKRTGSKIVMLAVPPTGPPVILPIGFMLRGGRVMLDSGIEVEGVFWESIDRQIFDNGTMVYKQTGIVEQAKISYGTINGAGVVTLLPKINKRKTDLRVLRSINIAIKEDLNHTTTTTESPPQPTSKSFLETAWDTFDSIMGTSKFILLSNLGKRSTRQKPSSLVVAASRVRFFHSYMDVLTDIAPDDFWLERVLLQTACEGFDKLLEEDTDLPDPEQCNGVLLQDIGRLCRAASFD